MVLSTPLEPRAILSDARVENYIIHQEEEARKSIEQLPQLREEYYRHLLLELFDFHDILYKEEHLVRLMMEFFYHSFTDLSEWHKRVLNGFNTQIRPVAEKWLQVIRQMSVEQLHDGAFLERVKRSATYFEESINMVFADSLVKAADIKTNNKQAMTRFTDALAETRQAVMSRRYFLSRIAEQGFTIPIYLHEKQYSLLDAIDETMLKPKKERKTKRKKK